LTPPSSASALLARSRVPTAEELAGVPWMATLRPDEAAVAAADMRVLHAEVGEFVCRVGRPVTFWFGLIDGLLKMSNDSQLGMPITFTGLPPGGWFGEGTVLKHEPYRYNIQALRKSLVAGITVPTFDWLLDRSIGFNRFVMRQLNERLGQFIAAREIDRLSDPDVRVARSLASLFHPVLYPGVGDLLRITQQELGYLVGLSRQRVNQALHTLQAARMIRVEYGGVRVLDLEGMRRYTRPPGAAVPQSAHGIAATQRLQRATPTRPVQRQPATDAKG
jgi:CRP/FNR family transcriptional regulator, cyclic AMP receptor protein